MKSVRQLSAELGITKEAVYKKLKYQLKEQLEGHITKVDNVTHVDEEGERLIRQSLNRERREAIQVIMEDGAGAAIAGQPHINEYIHLLEEQVKTKDEQIETQSGHIGLLIRQLGNSQLLTQAERVRGLLAAQTGGTAAGTPAGTVKTGRRPLWRRILGR